MMAPAAQWRTAALACAHHCGIARCEHDHDDTTWNFLRGTLWNIAGAGAGRPRVAWGAGQHRGRRAAGSRKGSPWQRGNVSPRRPAPLG